MESNISAPQAIGKRIALLRQEKGLTQTELGNMIHQRREVVSYWENGSRDIKSGDIVLLADVLDTTCDYILRGIQSENIDIHRATGLCDEAIMFLQHENPPYNPEINILLTSEHRFEFLMCMDRVRETAIALAQIEKPLYEDCDEFHKAAVFSQWLQAQDNYDLALFRLTKVITEIAKEIKDYAAERGETDEEP